jgi:uroporphyrinogen III methyltransferase/synthase
VKDVALTPAAQDIVRQQLKLHLVSARMAWLSNMPHVCKDDLQQAQTLLAKHFQAQSSSVVAVQKNLTDIHAEVSKAAQMKKGQ